jgi:hypothetical protein
MRRGIVCPYLFLLFEPRNSRELGTSAGKRGDLNGSTQHSSRTQLALKTKTKSLARGIYSAVWCLWTTTEPVVLAGSTETYCLPCSADVATAILLMTEINAAKTAGQKSESMQGELNQVSKRLLGRAQSA